MQKSFSEHDAHVMGARIIAKERREEYAKKYKDDPDLLSQANESVDSWLEQQQL
jgi:hypothetical protein